MTPRTIHLRLNGPRGTPTPARLCVSDEAGTCYAPLGRSVEFPAGRGEAVGGSLLIGRERWFTTGGSCEIPLPPGVPLRVRATKGPDFRPLDARVTLGPGQLSLRFALERLRDGRVEGFSSADARAHFLSADSALLEAAAEGLDLAQVLAFDYRLASFDGHTYATTPGLDAFSGQTPARQSPESLVAVNTLNAHAVLGRVALLHAHRPVFPLSFGAPESPDDWGVTAWCEQARRKGGLAIWADPYQTPHGGEALCALVNGHIDAVEFTNRPRRVPFQPLWYRLHDAGLRAPLVGASAKDSNRVPLGAARTVARLLPGAAWNLASWADAVRRGRTAATTGPHVWLSLGDAEPGDASPGGECRAEAWSLAPFAKLELVRDGRVVESAPAIESGGAFTAALNCGVPPGRAGWLAARLALPGGFAHTSAITLTGEPAPAREQARAALRRSLAESRAWVESVAAVTSEAARAGLLAAWRDAEARLAPDADPRELPSSTEGRT